MRSREWPLFAYGAVIWCGAFSALVAFWQAYANQLDAQRKFAAEARRATTQIEARLATYEYALRGARGSVLSAGPAHLSRKGFRVYAESRDPAREFPGMRGVGVVQRVSVADEAAFVAHAREDDWPSFAIRQLHPHAGPRYVIEYVEPIATNAAAVGLDIASETKRRVAADESTRTGKATLTAPITLVQATGRSERAFLLLMPIFLPAERPGGPREHFGWTYGALVIDEVLAGLGLERGPYTIYLHDVSDDDSVTFYQSAFTEGVAANGLVERIAIPVHGRMWEAEVRATPRFVASLGQLDPRATGLVGVALTLLLGVLTSIYEQASQRAAQVRSEQARRAVIVDASNDAIIGVDPTGTVVDWNPAAERLFGYTADEARGRSIDDLIVPDDERHRTTALRAQLRSGAGALDSFEAVRRAKDGSLIDVTATASPIRTARGAVLGIAIIFRDAREMKQAARKVLELNASLERQVQERTALLESAYRENEALLRTLNVHAVVSVADAAGHIIDVNDAFCRISGYTRSELLGQTHVLLESDQHPPELYRTLRETVNAGQPWRGELCQQAKDGSLFWVDSVFAPFFDGDGKLQRIVCISTDITAAKRAEQRLRANEAFLDRVGRVAGVGGWELDLRTQALHWSEQTRRIHEVDDDYMPTLDKALQFYPVQRELLVSAIDRAMRDGTGYDVEVPFVTAKGNPKWVRAVGVAELEDGRAVRLVGSLQDISERKRSAALLQEANDRFEIAADAAGIAVWDFDLATGRLVCDDRMYDLYCIERTDADPQDLLQARVHPDDRARVQASTEQSIRSGEPLDDEFRIVWPNGDVRHIKANARVNYDDAGRSVRVVGVNMDVTEQKRAELALLSATQKAEQANVAKSQFLANMSHEIRTPMNAVIGFSYLMGKTALSEEQNGLLAKIQNASKSLLAVINDVLDLSKIEAGELVVERAPFQLDDLVRGLTDVALVQADAKGIALTLDVAPTVPRTLEGDVTRLNQILTNLLSNAVKFTEKGGVVLRVHPIASDAAARRVTLRFTVEDTGIGIDPEVQPRLFAPFAQADASTTRRFGGTGLGLSIVKRLTELMGGEVRLESTPNVGSAFSVDITFGARTDGSARPEAPSYDELALRGIRVLVVDDSYVNMEMVKRILEAKGAIVELAGNGHEAVDHLERTSTPPDIVLMDVHMPVLDGHDATLRIRNDLAMESLPIVALTAGALTTERQRAIAAGMNDFLTKPFDTRDLVRVIRRHCAPVDEVCTVTLPPAPPVQTGAWPKIRGIDDAEVHARLGGDLSLFASMLERLLAEFAAVRLDDPSPAALAEHASRMHKLRGSAGMLAARIVRDLAQQAEAACRAGDRPAAVRLSERIEDELRELRESALPVLRTARGKFNAPQDDEHEDDLVVLSKMVLLVQSLRQHDLAAVEQFEELAPRLRTRLDHDSFLLLRGYVQSLRFTDAAGIIQSKLDAEHALEVA